MLTEEMFKEAILCTVSIFILFLGSFKIVLDNLQFTKSKWKYTNKILRCAVAPRVFGFFRGHLEKH